MRRTTTTALAMTAAVALTACGTDDPGTSAGQEEPSEFTPTVEEATEAPDVELDPTTEPAAADPTTSDGSEAPEPSGTETSDEARTGDGPSATTPTLASSCETDRFLIRYPEGWWTNPGTEARECHIFHPSEISVQNESLHYAVWATVDNISFDRATQEQDGEMRRETFTVQGRDAVETEVESDGRGLIPEGETSTLVFIDLAGDQTLVMSTHTIGDTDYEHDATVLRRMAESIELTG